MSVKQLVLGEYFAILLGEYDLAIFELFEGIDESKFLISSLMRLFRSTALLLA